MDHQAGTQLSFIGRRCTRSQKWASKRPSCPIKKAHLQVPRQIWHLIKEALLDRETRRWLLVSKSLSFRMIEDPCQALKSIQCPMSQVKRACHKSSCHLDPRLNWATAPRLCTSWSKRKLKTTAPRINKRLTPNTIKIESRIKKRLSYIRVHLKINNWYRATLRRDRCKIWAIDQGVELLRRIKWVPIRGAWTLWQITPARMQRIPNNQYLASRLSPSLSSSQVLIDWVSRRKVRRSWSLLQVQAPPP